MDKYLDLKEKIDYEKLKEPAKILRDGGIVVFPTETVYGIGANALNEEAVKNIYKIKNRDINKPLSILISNMEMINQVAENITELEYKLMKKFFPGPFTIIINKKEIIPDVVTANKKTVGVRMPNEKIALKLIEMAGVPIATPSANISGKPSGTNIEDIKRDFKENVDFYIDGGESKIGVPSTIVQVINGVPHILRQGVITEEEIKKVMV